MSYTIFVDDLAAYVTSSLGHAKSLAEPFIGLGKDVAIRHYDDDVPAAAWRYDFRRFEWVAFERESAPAREAGPGRRFGLDATEA